MANNKDFKVKNGIQPTVYHEGLGTVSTGTTAVGYNMSEMDTVVSESNITNPTGVNGFDTGDSGTVLFMVTNNATGDRVSTYTMSTAYDLSTLSATGDYIDVSSQENAPSGIALKPDGTSFYIIGSGSDEVFQYNMTTAFDVSTASYASKSMSVTSQDGVPYDVNFSPDGTRCYVSGGANTKIFQYELTTAWDISTGSYTGKSFNTSTQTSSPNSFSLSSDGTKWIIVNAGTYVLHEMEMSTAFDISTSSATGTTFTYPVQRTRVKFSDDGSYVYSYGNPGADYYAHDSAVVLATNTLDLSTGSVFEITPTSDIQIGLSNPADSGTVSQATLLLDGVTIADGYNISTASYDNASASVSSEHSFLVGIAFSSDGSYMYTQDYGSSNIKQWSLSTPWNVSSASYASVSLNTSSQDGDPVNFTFKPDGTKLYVSGYTTGAIYQYTLSIPWAVSNATYDSVSLDVTSETTSGGGSGLAFNDDGTKLFVTGYINNTIYEYVLSTAYDLSTASYNSASLSVSSQDIYPYQINFNSDGTKLFMIGISNDKIHQYSLSTAYDLTTASYDSVFFDVSSVENDPYTFAFKPDGTKMYVAGNSSVTVYQYTTGTSTDITVTYDSALQWGGGTAPDSPAANETDVLTFSTRDGGTTYQAAIAIDGAA